MNTEGVIAQRYEPTFFANVWKHFSNWATEYAWTPLAFLVVIGMIHFAHHLTGRPPTESADFLVALGFRLMACIFLIVLLSLTRECVGHWYTKDEIKAQPMLAWPGAIAMIAFGIIYAYVLLH